LILLFFLSFFWDSQAKSIKNAVYLFDCCSLHNFKASFMILYCGSKDLHLGLKIFAGGGEQLIWLAEFEGRNALGRSFSVLDI